MDAFFASVEIAHNPQLRGKPVCVGGGEQRGVVSAASYEARKYGIHSAMPGFEAKQKCPSVVFIPPHFQLYSHESKKVMNILEEITPDLQQISVDEAVIAIQGLHHRWDTEEQIALHIKQRVKKLCKGITCSIGVGPSRVTAKVASNYQKPDGYTFVYDPQNFLATVKLRDIPGIGEATLKQMRRFNITSVKNLQELSLSTLNSFFGEAHGNYLYNVVRGRDSSHIETTQLPPKSVSKSRTLDTNTTDKELLCKMLSNMSESLSTTVRRHGYYARTIGIVIRYGDFTTIRRSTTLIEPSQNPQHIFPVARNLLTTTLSSNRPVRLIGMELTNFVTQPKTITIFTYKNKDRDERLIHGVDIIQNQHGKGSIHWGSSM